MWVKVASFIIRNRLTLLLAVGLGAVAMFYFATKTEMHHALQKVIPDTDEASITYDRFKETFGEDGSMMLLGVESDKLFETDFFQDWYKLAKDIDSIENIERSISLANLQQIQKNDSAGRFELKPLLTRMPASAEEIEAFKQSLSQLPFYRNLIVDESLTATYIALTLDKEGVNTSRRVAVVDEIMALGEVFSAKHNTELHYSGVPYIRTINTRKISKELLLFTFLSIVITAVFMLLFFRSFQIVLISMVVVAICLIFTIGSMYLMGFKMGILTALIPPLIVVIAVQNCVYLFNLYHIEYRLYGNKIKAISRTISKIGLASFLTNATTAVGFGVFSFTGSSILDEFAKVAALNIMTVYALSIVIVPIVCSYLPPPNTKQLWHLERKTLNGVLDFVTQIVFGKRKFVYLISVVLIAVAVFGVFQVRTFGYILDGISHKDKLYKDLKFFERNFNGLFPYEIFIDTKAEGGVKEFSTLQKVEALGKRTRQISELSAPLSVAELFKYANQAYYDGNPKRYILPSPMDIGNIMQMFADTSKGEEKKLLLSMVDSNYQLLRVSMKIADVGTIRHEAINEELTGFIDSVFDKSEYDVNITGKSVITVKGNAYLIKNLITGLIWALAIISILMAFLFSSYKMVMIALFPNLIPLILTLAIMGYSGIPLKESTILIFSVAYGIVVDLTIHYLAKYRFELKKHDWNISEAVKATIRHSGLSMLYSTVILFFGFIIFSFSSFEGTRYLGILTSVALVLGLITNLFLLPSLLLWLEKRINMKKELSHTIIELEEGV
jgi:predicted RND superfamily exporter protein